MKNLLLALSLAFLSLPSSAQNLQKGDYGYLYCHMSDRGEYTAYAVSRDGYHYTDILGGNAIFDPKEHARIEGGTRDAYITRAYNGKGYLMVTTDMCVAKSHKWDNYGIDLLKSKDLILLRISVRLIHEAQRASEGPSFHGLPDMGEFFFDLLRCERCRIVSGYSCTDGSLSYKRHYVDMQIAFGALFEISKA